MRRVNGPGMAGFIVGRRAPVCGVRWLLLLVVALGLVWGGSGRAYAEDVSPSPSPSVSASDGSSTPPPESPSPSPSSPAEPEASATASAEQLPAVWTEQDRAEFWDHVHAWTTAQGLAVLFLAALAVMKVRR